MSQSDTTFLQSKYDEYLAQHAGHHPPNASQLVKFASTSTAPVRYREASNFLASLRGGGVNDTTVTGTSSQASLSASLSASPKAAVENLEIDYSGSTTGANNPWKQFQRKKPSRSTSSLTRSLMNEWSANVSTSTIANRKTKSKSLATGVGIGQTSVTSPPKTTTMTMKTSSQVSSQSSMHDKALAVTDNINSDALRSELSNLNKNFQKQCETIHRQFDALRLELTQKENGIIEQLRSYHEQCTAIMQRSINQTEQTTAAANANQHQDQLDKTGREHDSVEFVQISYDNDQDVDDEKVQKIESEEVVQSQKAVDSDEWSE